MNLFFTTGIRRISLKTGWIAIVVSCLVSQAAADSAFISVPLQRTGADPNASGSATITLAATTSSMVVQAANLAPGRTYTVASGGVVRGAFVTDGSGRGQLRFAQPPEAGSAILNFDPRGKALVIALNRRAVLRA